MLVPIAALAYFYDIPGWVSTLYSAHMLGFFAAAVALFGLGLWLKRGIVGPYLEMSQGSNVLGLIFLFSAIAAYVCGSWYGFTSWFHFESLVLLAVGYGFFRFDARFMKLTAPLLAMFALVLPFPFPDSWLYVPAAFVALVAIYVRAQPRATILPAIIVAAGALYWLYPAYWPLALAPLPCLALLVPGRLRMHEELRSSASRECALHDEPGTLVWGFCAMCGRKRAAIRQGHLGVIGLVVVLLTLYALAVTQVPVLSLHGGVPSSEIYSPKGITTVQIPPTPAGWLVNSSTRLTAKDDVYAVEQVYVPAYHPETENYTLYYELSPNATTITRSWNGIPGWSLSSSTYSSELPLQGRLITYASPQAVTLVFVGTGQLCFSNGSSFEQLLVGVSITREFRGTTVANATSEFTNGLQALFLPVLSSESYSSTWTNYFFTATQTATEVEGLLALVLSAGLIFWSAYRVELGDTKLDSFVTGASETDEEDYSLLATQLGASKSKMTGNEIAAMAGVKEKDTRMLHRIHSSLQQLERNGLMKLTLAERGSELILAWKVPV